jgi:hypothetical protein
VSDRRLYLFLSESARVPTGGPEDGQPLGEIYPEPFIGTLSMWSFSARVIGALEATAWQPTQDGDQINLVLTPDLADGKTRVIEERRRFRMVCMGLSRARWLAASTADKRRLLLEAFLGQLEQMRAAWSLDWPRLEADGRSLIESYSLLGATVGDTSPVSLGAELARRLALASWAELAPAAKLAIGRAVVEQTRATGRTLADPELVTLPSGERVVRTHANDIALVLAPSGLHRRGFTKLQLALADRIHRRVWGPAGDPSRRRHLPRDLLPFGADARCQLDLAAEAEIPAMWIAERTCAIEEPPPPWRTDDHDHAPDRPRLVTWRRALEFLRDARMTLPTSDELLYAASAGDARLFPWGDDPAPVDEDAWDQLDPFPVFRAPNPFGLAGALSHATWCMPLPDLDDPTPLVCVGGAMDFFPWQSSWEGMLFLTRVVSRRGFDGRTGPSSATVRPIIRLVA